MCFAPIAVFSYTRFWKRFDEATSTLEVVAAPAASAETVVDDGIEASTSNGDAPPLSAHQTAPRANTEHEELLHVLRMGIDGVIHVDVLCVKLAASSQAVCTPTGSIASSECASEWLREVKSEIARARAEGFTE